ncbi:S-methyl-5-thioribose-1-phosphate isomerase [Stratiformator vulcanicus]|uniref:Methylthioribose-1-phosphate isomerase n=1 Tax=Stratiformator vulcanicus TaxID=2527980 RepID=A0A517R5Q3_9PLAN|nr:S-methyl-5-thioribose-1-phosphate isomerase [Stratiformator vulcanicus]QDT39224.1 Methylthioribose-1-phosphate isomerase [Stratiformator vulcanicus]
MAGSTTAPPRTMRWEGDIHGALRLIDQTKLPETEEYIECSTVDEVWDAIKKLKVRGAPAIGVAAAYGVVLGAQTALRDDRFRFDNRISEICEYLATSRPTAVNLFWALDRMRKVTSDCSDFPPTEMAERLLEEARAIEHEDREMCAAIGRHGAELLPTDGGVMTHCNAGGLATAGDGTALSVIFAAVTSGKPIHVYANETRPLLQGSRLTAWELMKRDVPCTLICDNMAGQVMKEGRIKAVVTGADRIAANGDAANKIGTYSVAVLAKQHDIPFYIAAPSSTFDMSLSTGDEIPIEERQSDEITMGFGKRTAPEQVNTYNPAFDVTPASLIEALITEKGIIRPVNEEEIRRVLEL